MSQELAVQEQNANEQALAIQAKAQKQAAQMAEAGIELEDLEIPKLMLMQPMSELVGADKAKLGDIVNTMTGEVVGSLAGSAVEIIPLKQFKTVRIYNTQEQPMKFLRVEEANEKNSSFDMREGNENGVPIRRVLNMNFFVLIKKELDADEAFPAVISFKSTSIGAGKQVATQMFKMLQLNRLPYSKSVKISSKKAEKDKKVFAVFEVQGGEKQTEAVEKIAAGWLASLAAAKNVKIVGDDGDADDVQEGVPAKAPTVVEAEVVSKGSADNGPY